MKIQGIGIGLLLLTATVGCHQIHDNIDDRAMATRDRYSAENAWWRWKSCYEEIEHRSHFAAGFKAGYMDVVSGGDGCQPALPPRKYWKVRYQNDEGKCKTRAWFNGFSHGALAAEQDGMADLSEIMVSPVLQEQMIPAGAEHHIQVEPKAENLDQMIPPAPGALPTDADATQLEADQAAVD